MKRPPYFAVRKAPVAFVMDREDFTCATVSYETPVFEAYGADGARLQATGEADPTGRYRKQVAPGGPDQPLLRHVCRDGGAMEDFAKRRGAAVFDAPDRRAAFLQAQARMQAHR